MYRVNPLKYNGVTVIPSEIIENHLILASSSQLKVIIYAFSKAAGIFDTKTISEGTGVSENEVKDALSYWKDMGFILYEEDEISFVRNDTVINNSPITKEEKNIQSAVTDIKKPEKIIPSNNPVKLSYNEICTRINESDEVRILLNEAQLRLGRTIGTGDQSSLILLHDYYGLPVEVILCICEYAGTKGKSTNMNYIYKIGVDWSQREIDTIDAADEELKSIEKVNSVWAEFCKEVSLKSSYPTITQEKYISQWVNEWKFSIPVLVLAYDEMMTHSEKLSFSYMHKILTSWYKKGINTPEKVSEEKERFIREAEQKAFEKSKNKKTTVNTVIMPDPTASYDIKRAEERALTSIPKIKKREKR